jgi:hypothetical protein
MGQLVELCQKFAEGFNLFRPYPHSLSFTAERTPQNEHASSVAAASALLRAFASAPDAFCAAT